MKDKYATTVITKFNIKLLVILINIILLISFLKLKNIFILTLSYYNIHIMYYVRTYTLRVYGPQAAQRRI